ncbi:UDP-N-acetylmuramoyl-L-alanyl-D-glutamate--2,6-diaminopimelate ligase [Fenollaria massiliensis]|uniref:UDP-N-acetylmuramoyl-L-alanyl-D-glutamate--2, 6-diaminopimelate ligase n=1 Tax=Fenollaria massiliensis TaxID=938288 RepID=UPI000364A0B1|nr:UDP-N-acetylmuramoyl-L-alanyl-D-glutamate--2,6-diaminopimelate ligase [Fenollaria massiliensis]
MLLKDILLGICDYTGDEFIEDIVYNSKYAQKGTLFVALRGALSDGHKYIKDAYEKGVRVFVVEDDSMAHAYADATFIKVNDTRKALAIISRNFFNKPDEDITMIAITGTKGKTTTANIIYEALKKMGAKPGIIGTNGVFYADKDEAVDNTTPESYEVYRILNNMRKEKITHCVLEASSIGLKMKRLYGINFDIGVFTNISHDHIGGIEHPNFDDYFHSKMLLKDISKKFIYNKDDEKLRETIKNGINFSINEESDYKAENIVISDDIFKIQSDFDIKGKVFEVKSISKYDIYNYLAAISVLKEIGYDWSEIIDAVKNISIRGRFEEINVNDRLYIIDYAHNYISLKSILETLKHFKKNKIITVFGSVGGRSEKRREELAEVSDELADISIVTSDNPNFEDPAKICNEIASFIKGIHYTEPDREKAIKLSYELSQIGDIIVVAGKGHETYQLIKGEKVHYSDKECILKLKEAHDA